MNQREAKQATRNLQEAHTNGYWCKWTWGWRREEGPLEGQCPAHPGVRSMKPRASRIMRLRSWSPAELPCDGKETPLASRPSALIHWFLSSAVSHSSHLWAVPQFVSITPDLAAKGETVPLKKVCQPRGHSGKAFNGKGIRVDTWSSLICCGSWDFWLSPSLQGRQVSWIAYYFLRSNFHAILCK